MRQDYVGCGERMSPKGFHGSPLLESEVARRAHHLPTYLKNWRPLSLSLLVVQSDVRSRNDTGSPNFADAVDWQAPESERVFQCVPLDSTVVIRLGYVDRAVYSLSTALGPC